MTTNKPTTYWAPSTALHQLESRHNNAPCILTDCPAEFNDVALVRLADYEALQAECEKLRKDAELWDSIHDEIHRRADKEHALADRCDFDVTIMYEDYAAMQGDQP